MKRVDHLTLLCLCAGLALGMTTSCSKPADNKKSEAAKQSEETAPLEGGGRLVTLTPEAIAAAGIVTGAASPHRIEVNVEAPGEIRINSERVVQIKPRFAGTVRELRKTLGDEVRKGEVVALINSNESFSSYEITASLAGSVVARGASIGQAVEHDDALYTIADLSSVWADFTIYPQLAGKIRRGQRVRIRSELNPGGEAWGTVSYVGPLLDTDTRSTYGRVVIANRQGEWSPGLFFTATITVSVDEVPIAVPAESIVRMSDGPAVFLSQGTSFTAVAVGTGRTDGVFTEITQGLEPGARIVVKKAFLLKAEIGKSEAGDED